MKDVYKYLEEVGAVGKAHAVNTKVVMVTLGFKNTREVKKAVANERVIGRLICSSLSGGGGYYLPKDDAEIYEMKRRLEKGFVSRANAVRAFRHAVREIEKRKAGGTDGKEEALRP